LLLGRRPRAFFRLPLREEGGYIAHDDYMDHLVWRSYSTASNFVVLLFASLFAFAVAVAANTFKKYL